MHFGPEQPAKRVSYNLIRRMKQRKYLLLVCAAGQTLITFDDIDGINSASFGPVPNGYKNLNWTNAFFVNTAVSPYLYTGYWAARGSLNYVAAMQNSTPLSFAPSSGGKISLYFFETSVVWRQSVGISITTVNGGTIVTHGVGGTAWWSPGLFSFNFRSFDAFQISASGGTLRTGSARNDTDIAVDNLCISYF